MPRRRARPRRVATLTTAMRQVLETGTLGEPDDQDPVDSRLSAFLLPGQPDELRRVWRDVGPELLRSWVRARPGTRPWCWWLLEAPAADAPEVPAAVGRVIAARQQLDGCGVTTVPVRWSDRGAPLVDASTVFESEASYLDRHNLLLSDAERRALPPTAFDPETVVPHDDEGADEDVGEDDEDEDGKEAAV